MKEEEIITLKNELKLLEISFNVAEIFDTSLISKSNK